MSPIIQSRFSVVALALLTAGCVTPYYAGNPYPYGRPAAGLVDPAQTIGLESSDRSNRFRRLASLGGIMPPDITVAYAPAGTMPGVMQPIPVVRVTFDDRAFFDTGNDQARPEASQILDLVAENMRRDVPDAQLTLIGHTDAQGSDAYNDDLSLRRARSVFQQLAARRVDPAQLSTVAVGKRQPIAPNDTAEGRARNRRVEFLVSANVQANLAVLSQVPIQAAWLRIGTTPVRAVPAAQLAIMRPVPPAGPVDLSEAPMVLREAGRVELQPAAAEPSLAVPREALPMRATPAALVPEIRTPATPQVVGPAPRAAPEIVRPRELERQELGPALSY